MARGESEAACRNGSRSPGFCLIELPRGNIRNISLRRFHFARNENPCVTIVYNPAFISKRPFGNGWTLRGSCRSSWCSTIVRSTTMEDRDGIPTIVRLFVREATVSSETCTEVFFPRKKSRPRLGFKGRKMSGNAPAKPTRWLFYESLNSWLVTIFSVHWVCSNVDRTSREAMSETSWRWSIVRSNAPDGRSITSEAMRFSLDSTCFLRRFTSLTVSIRSESRSKETFDKYEVKNG